MEHRAGITILLSIIPTLLFYSCSGCSRTNAVLEDGTLTIENRTVVKEELSTPVYVAQPIELLAIRRQLDSLYQYDPINATQKEINDSFKQILIREKAYTEQLLHEIYKQSSQKTIRELKAEDAAYQTYHAALINAFRKLNERLDGFDGSAWPMAILSFAIDDTKLRQESLFCMINDTLKVAVEKVAPFHIQSEYSRFLGNLHEEVGYYSVKEQEDALQSEQKAWEKWMSTRARVSSSLDDNQKQIYDRMTDYIMKGKLLAINNEYQGFTMCPDYICRLCLNYSNTLDEITKTCFSDRLREYFAKDN